MLLLIALVLLVNNLELEFAPGLFIELADRLILVTVTSPHTHTTGEE